MYLTRKTSDNISIFCPKGVLNLVSECTKKTMYFCQQPSKTSNKCNDTCISTIISKETNIKSERISNNAVYAK